MSQDWTKIKLGDIGKISMCKRILKKQTSSNGDIPFFKIGTFGKDEDAYIPKDLYEEYKEKYSFPRKGEILISASGTIGRTVVYDGQPAYFQDSNIIWISNDEKLVFNRFLNYLYKIVTWQTASGTIARLYNDNVRQIQIVVPPLPEQSRIVVVLETWDKAIDLLKKKIELKKQVKKGLMQKLLSGEVRLPGFSGEWKMVRLGKVVDVVSGGTPSTSKEEYWEGNIPWVTPTEITKLKTRYINETSRKITDLGLKNSSATIVPENSLILCSRATVGACAINKKEITTNQGFKNLVPTNIDIYFLFYLIKTKKNSLVRISSGSTFLEFSKKDIQRMKVVLPSLEEQKAIASILTTADNEIDLLKQKIHALKQQKKFLLNNLVTGEIRTPEDLKVMT
jgi:type I restriction enzyme S subunit